MSDDFNGYFEPLDAEDRQELERRMERYREQLEDRGYELALAEGENGFFAGVLVIDEDRGRLGFLEADGTVAWLDADATGLGYLGSAIVQSHGTKLENSIDDAPFDVE
ncbi:hypothetical protein [Halorubrum sp. CBA1229]|jgi:L-amino acid N-acyltransferase YncA|uniref:hypothetical protein n=1 Tax=Halorubrum sp. CBA1229 TaxID=1853699 RepID=UPI000F3F608F|nr:hypothetical protein [Halorubrum sp. CBA1229]QKY17812.1 hypothetical protein Hrr1229_013300 [Halorubrum sp. CBA1229]